MWGASSSSYQTEGAWREDGKGESIWDRFCHNPGNVDNGDTGDIACDSYHWVDEDAEIMGELGLMTQRLSISWPRVFPDGRGGVNWKGLDYYRREVDALRKNGVDPFIMLYHWDLPQKLQDRGGWTNRDTSEYFADFARIIFDTFPTEIPHWGTILEPQIIAYHGYWDGTHAPGIRDFSSSLEAAHNLMRAHGLAVRQFRDSGAAGEIGITNYLPFQYPASSSAEDIAACSRYDGAWVRWFLDPIFNKGYPADMLSWYEHMGVTLPKFTAGDMDLIAEPMDFLGLNYYYSNIVGDGCGRWPLMVRKENFIGREHTAMGWPSCPEGLKDSILRVYRDYGLKIIVTENGAAFADEMDGNGEVHDPRRIEYLRRHIAALHEAMDEGADVRGYMVWAPLDNFEWARGYDKRFGLCYVDYETQKRTIKDSGRWYGEVIKNNGLTGMERG